MLSSERKDGVCRAADYCHYSDLSGVLISSLVYRKYCTMHLSGRQPAQLNPPGNFPASCSFYSPPQPRCLPLTWQVRDDPVLYVDVPGFNGEHLLQRFLQSRARHDSEDGTRGTLCDIHSSAPSLPPCLVLALLPRACVGWIPHLGTGRNLPRDTEPMAPTFKGQKRLKDWTQEPLLNQVCFEAISDGIHPPSTSPPPGPCVPGGLTWNSYISVKRR